MLYKEYYNFQLDRVIFLLSSFCRVEATDLWMSSVIQAVRDTDGSIHGWFRSTAQVFVRQGWKRNR